MTSQSYSRNCRYCGRRIQLRKMPHGKWVAFEGWDTPHNCSSVPPKTTKPSAPGNQPMSKSDPDFIEFDMPRRSYGAANDKGRPPSRGPDSSQPRHSPPTRRSHNWGVWIFWAIVIVVIINTCVR